MTDETPGWSDKRARHWTGVFLVNLIVPSLLGLMWVSRGGGAAGAMVATTGVWAAGLVLCGRSARVGDVLIRGGFAVAVCQIVPIIHLICGIAAMVTWESFVGPSWPYEERAAVEASGFAVALLTAMPLLFAAVVCGGGHRLILETDADGDEPAEPSDE
jgi:hypothetical protein